MNKSLEDAKNDGSVKTTEEIRPSNDEKKVVRTEEFTRGAEGLAADVADALENEVYSSSTTHLLKKILPRECSEEVNDAITDVNPSDKDKLKAIKDSLETKKKSAILGINPEKEVRYDGQGDDNCLKVCQNPEDEKARFGVMNWAEDKPEDVLGHIQDAEDDEETGKGKLGRERGSNSEPAHRKVTLPTVRWREKLMKPPWASESSGGDISRKHSSAICRKSHTLVYIYKILVRN